MAEILDYDSPKALALRQELGEMIDKGISSHRRVYLVELLLESGRVMQEKKLTQMTVNMC